VRVVDTKFSSVYSHSVLRSLGSFGSRVFIENNGGYPRAARIFFYSRWQTVGVPFALTPICQLHQSPPSPGPQRPIPIEQKMQGKNPKQKTVRVQGPSPPMESHVLHLGFKSGPLEICLHVGMGLEFGWKCLEVQFFGEW